MRDGCYLVRASRKSADFMLMLCYGGQPHNFRIKTVRFLPHTSPTLGHT